MIEAEALATKISRHPVGSSASMLLLASLALNEQKQKHDRILIIVGMALHHSRPQLLPLDAQGLAVLQPFLTCNWLTAWH